MEFKGTKGGWKKYNAVQLGVTLSDTFIVKAGDCQIIVNKVNLRQEEIIPKEEAEANAKLIAAAPELLEALQEMMNQFEDVLKSSGNANLVPEFKCFQKSQQAIEKALK